MNSLDKLVQITKNFNRELEENAKESRINIIAQNGNDGYHYNLDGELENPKKEVTEDLSSLIANFEKNQTTFENLKKLLDFAIKSDVQTFHKYSKLGIDLFPAQPFIYLSRGKSLQMQKKPQEAIDVLESGFDFVIENPSLEIQFYNSLAKSYTRINNPTKAKEYSEKVKKIKI